MTNSERESTIKKSTTHVVSGAFDVAHSWTISLSDNWIIAFVVLVVSGAFDVVSYATSDRSVTGKSSADMETNIVSPLWIVLSFMWSPPLTNPTL